MSIIPDTSTLTEVQQAFLDRFQLGVVAIGRDAWSLMSILAGIEIALFGLWWTLSGSDAAAAVFRKVLTLGFFVFVLSNYQDLINVITAGFAHTAETAAGARMASIDDPSAIIDAAYTATLPALELARKRLGFTLQGMIDAWIIILSVLGIFLAYCTLAIQVFITRLEFGMVSTLGLVLIPFGVLRQTAFLAEKTFGAILGFGIKLMILGFIISISWPILSTWALPPDPDWGHLLNMLAATLAIAVLSFHAPAVASGMLWGTPSLTHGHGIGAAHAVGSPVHQMIKAGVATGVGASILSGGKSLTSTSYQAAKNFRSQEDSSESSEGTKTGGQSLARSSANAKADRDDKDRTKGRSDEPSSATEEGSADSVGLSGEGHNTGRSKPRERTVSPRTNRRSTRGAVVSERQGQPEVEPSESTAFRPFTQFSEGDLQKEENAPSLGSQTGGSASLDPRGDASSSDEYLAADSSPSTTRHDNWSKDSIQPSENSALRSYGTLRKGRAGDEPSALRVEVSRVSENEPDYQLATGREKGHAKASEPVSNATRYHDSPAATGQEQIPSMNVTDSDPEVSNGS